MRRHLHLGGRALWRRWIRSVLVALVAYPRTLWRLSAAYPRRLRQRHPSRSARWASYALQALLYTAIGFPATLYVTGEVLIVANGVLVPQDVHAQGVSDFAAADPNAPLELPGAPVPSASLPHREATGSAGFYDALAERYAPVVVQRVAQHPEWDLPSALDFDGDDDPRNNVVTERTHRPVPPVVYGELTAETEDSYYLTYSLYHVKDYDHPIRELVSDATFHDNDNEGFHLRVDKASGDVVEVETWFHNRFLFYNRSGTSQGTEPVHGAIHLESSGTRVLVYVQPQGHGVRLLQRGDLAALVDHTKILRPAVGGAALVPVAATDTTEIGTYHLENFDRWYEQASPAMRAAGRSTYFAEELTIGENPDGTPLTIPRYIAGERKAKWTWVRPKPPWSWDDGWDELPIFVWHFFPSVSFESHGGTRLSHTYLFDRPSELTFGLKAPELEGRLRLRTTHRHGDKWEHFNHEELEPEHWEYWQAGRKLLVRYVNYLFEALG